MVYTRAAAELIKNFYDIGSCVLEQPRIKEKIERLIDALGKATNGGDRDDYLESLKHIVYLEKALMVYKAARSELDDWIEVSMFLFILLFLFALQKSAPDGPAPNSDEIDQLVCYQMKIWDKSHFVREDPGLFPKGYSIAGAGSSPLGRVIHKFMCNGKTDDMNYAVFPKPTK